MEKKHSSWKKSTHPGKKAQKTLQPIKKKQVTEKKYKKYYGADKKQKGTHYDPRKVNVHKSIQPCKPAYTLLINRKCSRM